MLVLNKDTKFAGRCLQKEFGKWKVLCRKSVTCFEPIQHTEIHTNSWKLLYANFVPTFLHAHLNSKLMGVFKHS